MVLPSPYDIGSMLGCEARRLCRLVSIGLVVLTATWSPSAGQNRGWSPPPKATVDALDPVLAARTSRAVAAVESAFSAGGSGVAEALVELGDVLCAAGLFNDATRAYSTALGFEPERADWWLRAGRAQLEARAHGAAILAIERSLELDAAQPIAEEILARALIATGRPAEAEAAWRRALSLAPDSPGALWGLGRHLAEAGDRDAEAVRLLSRLAELQPQATEVLYPLAQAERRLGRLDRARDLLARSGEGRVILDGLWQLRLDALRSATWLDQLASELDRGLSDAALFERIAQGTQPAAPLVAELEPAISGGDPPSRRARWAYARGALALRDGDESGAEGWFRRAIELDPTMVDPLVRLGNAAARVGRYTQAGEWFEQARRLAPTDVDILLKIAALETARGDRVAARSRYEEILRLAPRQVEAHLRLAALLDDLGDFDQAERMLRQALDLELQRPEAAEAHTRLARLLRRRELFDESLAHSRQALEADPRSVPALADAAVALASRGRLAEAAPLYRRWVELVPDDPKPRLPFAMALVLTGQQYEAKDVLLAAVAQFPDDERLADLLARHLAAAPDPSIRDGRRALELAERAMARAQTPERAETLAMALAETGQFEAAASLQQQLVDGLEAAGLSGPQLERMRQDLERYRRGSR
jgi:tetratricopeptide (TPR) repeat protein